MRGRTIWGRVASAVAAAGELLRLSVQVGDDEEIDQAEHMGQYGVYSRPRQGAEALLVQHGTQRVVVGTADRRYTITLADGDVALATDDDQVIRLKGSGGIEIETAGDVTIKATGKIDLGSVVQKLVTEAFLTSGYDVHTHVCASPGSPSATPIPTSVMVPTGVTTKVSAQ